MVAGRRRATSRRSVKGAEPCAQGVSSWDFDVAELKAAAEREEPSLPPISESATLAPDAATVGNGADAGAQPLACSSGRAAPPAPLRPGALQAAAARPGPGRPCLSMWRAARPPSVPPRLAAHLKPLGGRGAAAVQGGVRIRWQAGLLRCSHVATVASSDRRRPAVAPGAPRQRRACARARMELGGRAAAQGPAAPAACLTRVRTPKPPAPLTAAVAQGGLG